MYSNNSGFEIVKLDLTIGQKQFLDEHKICISDAYLGMLRAYKDNRVIWQSGGAIDIAFCDINKWLDECDIILRIQCHEWLNKLIGMPKELLDRELSCNYDFMTGGRYEEVEDMKKWKNKIKIKDEIFDVVEHTDKECGNPRTDGQYLAPISHEFVCVYQDGVYKRWRGTFYAEKHKIKSG